MVDARQSPPPAHPTNTKGWHAYLFLTITASCWAGNAVAGQFAIDHISPMMLVALRWLGAVILLCLLAHRQIRKEWPILRQRLPYLAAMGALGYTVFNAMFYVAAHTTTALHVGIIQGAVPVFVLLGMSIAYRSRIPLLSLIGAGLSIAGVVLVALHGNILAIIDFQGNSGDLIMIAACTFYAGYTVALRRRPAVSALPFLAVMAASAFVASLPLLAIEASLGYLQWPTRQGWWVTLFVTLFPSFLGQLLFILGVNRIGPSRGGMFVNLVPVFAAFLAVTLLGEHFFWFHAVSLLLVLGGIALSERAKP